MEQGLYFSSKVNGYVRIKNWIYIYFFLHFWINKCEEKKQLLFYFISYKYRKFHTFCIVTQKETFSIHLFWDCNCDANINTLVHIIFIQTLPIPVINADVFKGQMLDRICGKNYTIIVPLLGETKYLSSTNSKTKRGWRFRQQQKIPRCAETDLISEIVDVPTVLPWFLSCNALRFPYW